MKLGTVAACLRDLPRTLWDCPLADFTVLTLRKLAEMYAAKAAGWDEMFREDSGAFYLSQQRPAMNATHVLAAGPNGNRLK